MLKPPPMFDFGQPAQLGVDPAAGSDRTAAQIVPTEDSDHWYAVANDIANAIFDAKSLAEVERVKSENMAKLRDLVTNRRDLAELLSSAFADRRRQLGRA